MTINEEVTNKVSTLPQGMAWKQIQRKEKAYLINHRSYCANTESINVFKEQIDKFEGTMIGSKDLESVKVYLENLVSRINKLYSDSDLEMRWIESWHGDNCSGFCVWSNYALGSVCDIYFIGMKKRAVISQRAENE